ncbi:MAG: hypothetical protein HY654_07800 [Acidobacteria bacterium]|nr:hypothetical protein [Acidobacteriota bacterium]
MAAALLTAIILSILGLGASGIFGLMVTAKDDLFRHTSLAIFSTLVNLLAHSMMMFYLIGKGRAVRDAMTEAGLTGDYYQRIAKARVPVFSWGTYAMGMTILTALLGASVDTQVLAGWVHAAAGFVALAVNLVALKLEIDAVVASARAVDEVNRRLA